MCSRTTISLNYICGWQFRFIRNRLGTPQHQTLPNTFTSYHQQRPKNTYPTGTKSTPKHQKVHYSCQKGWPSKVPHRHNQIGAITSTPTLSTQYSTPSHNEVPHGPRFS